MIDRESLHDLKTGIGLHIAQWAARQELGVPQKTLVEVLFGVVDEWAAKHSSEREEQEVEA